MLMVFYGWQKLSSVVHSDEVPGILTRVISFHLSRAQVVYDRPTILVTSRSQVVLITKRLSRRSLVQMVGCRQD